jgi:hypothetical protein
MTSALDEGIVFAHITQNQFITLKISFSKKDVEILTKVIHTIVLLLTDSNVVVVKKVMLCLTQLYRLMLQVRPCCFAVGCDIGNS